MTVRVLKAPRPEIHRAEAGSHHRRGWMRIGKLVTVWCTCGFKYRGEAKESEVEELWREHL
jgi:hypothetical protein